ncbi:unnamed protein product [Fraxinus pennsylvanica]|uniref:Uncharacterized protein n=1 Tax=Fraxinus pennsylvanica TaxID=56036 RepID=A0AAD2AD98_9LAMI|nr:unnamed protein product [Fraxinus pennsylvanica]
MTKLPPNQRGMNMFFPCTIFSYGFLPPFLPHSTPWFAKSIGLLSGLSGFSANQFIILETMKDNLTEASTRVTKGNAKFTMATKKDDVSKARTCVTKGISIGKNQTNSSSFKGRNDFSEAIGKLKELSVNPSSQDVPRKSCESNLLDDELMEFLGELHDHELCCKNPRKRMGDSSSSFNRRTVHGLLCPPPEHKVLAEQLKEQRKLFKASEERAALEIEDLLRNMSPVHIPK